MGIDHRFILFIGRPCTPKESKSFYKKLLDLNDIEKEHIILDEGTGDDITPYWTLDGFPVICGNMFIDFNDKDKLSEYDCDWYVCQFYICSVSHRGEEPPMDYTKWPKPRDSRYGLLRIYDVSY